MSLFLDVFGRLIMKAKRHMWGFMLMVMFTLLVCRNILFSSDFPAGTDMLGWIASTSYLSQDFKAYYLWLFHSFGNIGWLHSLYIILATLNLLVNNYLIVIKISIFSIFLLAGVSMYVFTYYCMKKQIPSLISSILFMISPFFIGQWAEGHLNFAFAYALGPMLLLTFDKALRSRKFNTTVAFVVILILIILARFDALAYYLPFLTLFVLFTIIFHANGIKRKIVLIRSVKMLLIGAPLVFLFCAFQFFPYFLGARTPYPFSLSEQIPVELLFQHSIDFLRNLIGMPVETGGFLIRTPPYSGLLTNEYTDPLNILLMSSFPLLAFSSIFFRRNKWIFFFFISALISIFLAKGPRQPFGNSYLWLWVNLPLLHFLAKPSRWQMITYFSYAFLDAVTIYTLYIRLRDFRSPLLMRIANHHRYLRKMSKQVPRLFLVSIMVSICLNSWSWYAVSKGLQTWRPCESDVLTYQWIAEKLGDFRVATVPYGYTYMMTDSGSNHDLGFESSLYHNKPVVRTGEAHPLASDFIGYTYRMVSTTGTNNLMNILGAFNVRYLVVQEYSPTWQHDFFSRQKGLHLVYVYENSTVFENEFWTPHVFAVSKYAIIVGGRETFTALTAVDNFNLSDWNLLFADQVANQVGVDQLLELINESRLLIFVNSEPLDLVMLTLENAIRIKAVDYAYPSINKYEHWISDDWWTNMGMLVLNRRVLLTSGNLSLSIPINVENSGEYDIWIRLLYGESRGNLSVKIDNTELGNILPYARHYSGLRWVKIGSAQLEQGQHDLTLTNNKSTTEWAQGDSTNIDEILLVKPQEFESAVNKTTRLLQQSPARIMSIIEGEQMFKWATTPHFTEWWTARQPFNASGGWVATTTSENTWIPLRYSISKDGRYSIALRMMVGPAQGTLRIAIDDENEYFLNATSQEPVFKWITFAPITLRSGNHTFDLYGEGKLEIDQIAIYSLNQNENETTLNDVFKTDKPKTTISYEMINPTMYTVHVETDTPFFLVFSDAYHNLWKAYIDGEEIRSIPAYSFINTFQISKTGEYDIVIEFIGQRYVVYGGVISIASITLTAIYLMFGVKINQFIVRKLKLKQRKEARENKREGMSEFKKAEGPPNPP